MDDERTLKDYLLETQGEKECYGETRFDEDE